MYVYSTELYWDLFDNIQYKDKPLLLSDFTDYQQDKALKMWKAPLLYSVISPGHAGCKIKQPFVHPFTQ